MFVLGFFSFNVILLYQSNIGVQCTILSWSIHRTNDINFKKALNFDEPSKNRVSWKALLKQGVFQMKECLSHRITEFIDFIDFRIKANFTLLQKPKWKSFLAFYF